MDKKAKFINFLESLKGKGENILIEAVKSGFQICFENDTVNNPNFRKWFGKSIVTDENGNPLVVYHRGYFNEDEDSVLSIDENGMHFGTKQAADERPSGKFVDDFLKDLEVEQDENGRWHWSSGSEESFNEEGFDDEEDARADAENVSKEMQENYEWEDESYPLSAVYLRIENPMKVSDQKDNWEGAIKKAKANGHDGIIYVNKFEDKGSLSFIVFDASQVKSVNNSGKFSDPNNILECQ